MPSLRTYRMAFGGFLTSAFPIAFERGLTMDWSVVFDGIGSSVIGAIVGAVVTAAISIPVSYRAGRKSVRQSQKAGDEARQIQVGSIGGNDE